MLHALAREVRNVVIGVVAALAVTAVTLAALTEVSERMLERLAAS